MSALDWRPVGSALLGSWPMQVAAWGREGIAAFAAELEARGVTPEAALVAVRSCSAGQRFPPTAPELAALARRDPDAPTFDEMLVLVFGGGGVLRARTSVRKGSWLPGERDRLDGEAVWARAEAMHPLVAGFVATQGIAHLRLLDLTDSQWGGARRKQLREAWDAHCAAAEDRYVSMIARRSAGVLGRPDFVGVVGAGRQQIGRGTPLSRDEREKA